MITKMKKYTFLVFHRDYEAFLTELREAGVVHVTQKAAGLAEDADLQSLITRRAELTHVLKQGAPDQLFQEQAGLHNWQNLVMCFIIIHAQRLSMRQSGASS